MKNTLIIVANPKIESFSFAMCKKYKKLAEWKWYNVEILDLYREKNQQHFFMFDDANKLKITSEMKYFQDKISKAEELVFVFPYWWGWMPAILKNFIDWNFSKWFAFEYVNWRPRGLLKNKVVKIFTTTWAPYFIYMLTWANRRLRKMFQQQIVEFCWMKLVSFNIFRGLDKSKTKSTEILKKLKV